MNSDTDNFVSGSTSIHKDLSNELWIKKYYPFGIEQHVINKKKKEEFIYYCT